MLSIDSKLFDENSSVRSRIIEYGNLADELHIVVYTKPGFEKCKISPNIFLYPTNTHTRPFYFIDGYKIAKKIINDGSFLITSQDAMANLLAIILKIVFKLPVQIQIHTDFTTTRFRKESFINFLRYISYSFSVRYSDCVRVASERIKHSLVKIYKTPVTKIQVLPIFVDIAKIQNAEIFTDLHEKYPQFKFIILMASRLAEEKNIALALDAFKDVLRTYPETGLVIVGDGPEKDSLGSLVSEYGIDKNVIFEGWQEDMISYHKTADLFLNTSNYEGYGMSLVEAIAADTAIVTTDVGIVGEILDKDNAFICEIGDARCIMRNIMNAIENKSVCKELSRSATHAISNFPRKNVYLELYRKNWEDCKKI